MTLDIRHIIAALVPIDYAGYNEHMLEAHSGKATGGFLLHLDANAVPIAAQRIGPTGKLEQCYIAGEVIREASPYSTEPTNPHSPGPASA